MPWPIESTAGLESGTAIEALGSSSMGPSQRCASNLKSGGHNELGADHVQRAPSIEIQSQMPSQFRAVDGLTLGVHAQQFGVEQLHGGVPQFAWMVVANGSLSP